MTDPLILLSGLPGTGKTRLANALSAQLHLPSFSKDRFQSLLRLRGLTGRGGVEGYELLFDMADQQLSAGVGVILDAVFPLAGFRHRARSLAETHGAPFKPIFCFCSDEAAWRSRMERRPQYVPNWTPVGWDEVLKIRSYFEPWPSGSALEIDALQDFEKNLAQALQWIKAV